MFMTRPFYRIYFISKKFNLPTPQFLFSLLWIECLEILQMNAQTNSSLSSDDSLFFQKQVANGQRLPLRMQVMLVDGMFSDDDLGVFELLTDEACCLLAFVHRSHHEGSWEFSPCVFEIQAISRVNLSRYDVPASFCGREKGLVLQQWTRVFSFWNFTSHQAFFMHLSVMWGCHRNVKKRKPSHVDPFSQVMENVAWMKLHEFKSLSLMWLRGIARPRLHFVHECILYYNIHTWQDMKGTFFWTQHGIQYVHVQILDRCCHRVVLYLRSW